MNDPRLKRMADLLVNYSVAVKPGQWVGILGDVLTLPALREIYTAVVRAGGNPALLLSDEAMTRTLLREGSDAQLDWLDPAQTLYVNEGDVYIRIGGTPNTRSMTNIDPKRVQRWRAAQRPWLETRMGRAAAGNFNWVGAWYPNEASAQEANMSLEDYADFVFAAMYCDREDPVAEWTRVRQTQDQKVAWLKGKKQVKLQGPNIDLQLSIEGRTFINACGERNMPDGEIFTGPVEESVNGWVRFSYPSIVAGRAVTGIELKFEQGKVVQASAKENEDLLYAQLDTDAGSSTALRATSCSTKRLAARSTARLG
jgi:aminopeptidase